MRVFNAFPSRGSSKYDWDTWFDGQVRLLEHGVDFHGELTTIRSYIYQKARNRGIKVYTQMHDEGLLVQAKVAQNA